MESKAVTTKASSKNVAKTIDPFDSVVEAPKSVKAPTKKASEPKAKIVRKTVKAAKAVKPVAAFDSVAVDPIVPAVPASKPKRAAKAPAKKTAVKAAAKVSKPKTTAATKSKRIAKTAEVDDAAISETPAVEVSPVFKALADVELPRLEKENRARLLMQSPSRLYFYWSVKGNPWQQLASVFGNDTGSYTLVLKLTDLVHGREEVHQVEAEGTWWFDVEADGNYQAEIGFYAPNRPYFRVVYSNEITTPRRSPSPHPSSDAKWTVSANKFAEVLDVAGFSRDAYDVALAGDDIPASTDATHVAFSSFVGKTDLALGGIAAEDIRYAMMALASGFTLEELRSRVSPALFAILRANAEKLSSSSAQGALRDHFDIEETEWTEEEFGAAVYGASLVHFPKTLKAKKLSPKHSPRYNPVSSHSIRS